MGYYFYQCPQPLMWLQQLGGVQLSVHTCNGYSRWNTCTVVVSRHRLCVGYSRWNTRTVVVSRRACLAKPQARPDAYSVFAVCCIQCLKFVHVECLKVFSCCTLKLLYTLNAHSPQASSLFQRYRCNINVNLKCTVSHFFYFKVYSN